MLEYLESKYGEQFTPVDVSGFEYLPPDFKRSGELIVRSNGSPAEYFSVIADEGQTDSPTDSRVLSAWARRYSESYARDVSEAFGKNARVVVQLDSPDGWGLGKEQLDEDPSNYFSDRQAPYSFVLHVMVPVSTGGFQLENYHDAITRAYSTAEEVSSAGGFAQLVVYFYREGENVDDYVSLSTMPAANVTWRAMPGIVGAVVAGPGTPLVTTGDLRRAYHEAEE